MNYITKTSDNYFVAHSATILGDVTIGEMSSFWFNTIIRGDVAPIIIGKRVNVQDGAIIHCETDETNTIEDDVSIAHGAIVHGSFVGQGTLIGIRATLLGRTRIGRNCLIAAGAVVPPGMQVPDNSVVMGIPGKIIRPVSAKELEYMKWVPGRYIDLAEKYLRGEIKGAT